MAKWFMVSAREDCQQGWEQSQDLLSRNPSG